MRGFISPICAFVTFASFPLIAGCQTLPQARVVRVALQSDTGHWRVKVNGEKGHSDISNSSLTNQFVQLQLRQGDLVVFKDWPTNDSAPVTKTWSWVLQFCASNGVAMYFYAGHQTEEELFSIPIYNWTAPFSDPRALVRASFFDDGKFLGRGMDGYRKMVDAIAKTKPRKVLIVGGLHDMDSGFGPDERPYEQQQDLLDQALKNSGTELVLIDPLP
jgi:hypothetical protein